MNELVIARYREGAELLGWLGRLRPGIKITIYNKGGLGVPGEIPLPNVGLEDHTFLHHIITNYDHLADWTWFAQANPFDGCQNAPEVINIFPVSAVAACLTPVTGVYFFASCEPHRVEGLCYEHVWDRAVWEIFVQLFHCPAPPIMYFSPHPFFVASRKALLTRSKAFYEKCQEILLARPIVPGASFYGPSHPGSEVSAGAWEWERFWDQLWKREHTPYVKY